MTFPENLDGRDGGLLLIFSHPDDETFGCAGLMSYAVEAGIPVTLICATRGEAGGSSIPALEPLELLGSVREEELRSAMALLGVFDVRLLDYRDSGMPGDPANADPRALMNAPESVVADRLVVHLRALRPAAVVTFGEDGIYGHHDHVVIHRAAVAAVERAADPAHRPELGDPWAAAGLYFSTGPRDELQAMMERRGDPTNGMPPEQWDLMGTPREQIDVWLDTARWSDRKRRAMLAHHTQFGEGGPLANVPASDIAERLSRETFVRAALPWQATESGDDPVAKIARAHPYRRD